MAKSMEGRKTVGPIRCRSELVAPNAPHRSRRDRSDPRRLPRGMIVCVYAPRDGAAPTPTVGRRPRRWHSGHQKLLKSSVQQIPPRESSSHLYHTLEKFVTEERASQLPRDSQGAPRSHHLRGHIPRVVRRLPEVRLKGVARPSSPTLDDFDTEPSVEECAPPPNP